MSNKKDDWTEKAKEAVDIWVLDKYLCNKPTEAVMDKIFKRVEQALIQAKAEGMKEQLALTTRANTMNKAQKQSDQ